MEDAQKAGNAVGKDITVSEVLEALDEGHVNESSMVGDPEQMISAKERQLSTIGSSVSNYILRVRSSINEIVDKDQVLASQNRWIMMMFNRINNKNELEESYEYEKKRIENELQNLNEFRHRARKEMNVVMMSFNI